MRAAVIDFRRNRCSVDCFEYRRLQTALKAMADRITLCAMLDSPYGRIDRRQPGIPLK
jgi:hypothetical protein